MPLQKLITGNQDFSTMTAQFKRQLDTFQCLRGISFMELNTRTPICLKCYSNSLHMTTSRNYPVGRAHILCEGKLRLSTCGICKRIISKARPMRECIQCIIRYLDYCTEVRDYPANARSPYKPLRLYIFLGTLIK